MVEGQKTIHHREKKQEHSTQPYFDKYIILPLCTC